MYIRIFLCLGAITCAFTACKYQNINNDLANQNLKGRVRSVTTLSYELNKNNRLFIDQQTTFYDTCGNEIEAIDSNALNKSCNPVFYKIFYNNNRYAAEQQQYDGIERKPSWRTVFSYDKSGRLLETDRYLYQGHLIEKVVHRYDQSNKKVEQTGYATNGAKFSCRHLLYDQNGQLKTSIDTIVVDTVQLTVATCHTQFDAQGNRTEETYNNPLTETRYRCYKYESFDIRHNWLKATYTERRSNNVFTILQTRRITYY